jgi:L-ascorbate metabolism protein UlaG (beta-lactamase superfamily)
MQVTYIGHATVLIEVGGVRILTDPNFDARLGRVLPRVSAPGIALDALPSLDLILLTHAHADHLSFDSLDGLPQDVPIAAPPAIARWLRRLGYPQAMPLEPGANHQIGSLTVHAASATHRGNRYGIDRWRSAANMYLVDAGASTAFFAGDTALDRDTHGLVERVLWSRGQQLDLAMLPIGYAPWWKPGFRRGHLTHDDALALFERLQARFFMPYHWGTFRHVTATAHDAIRRLRAAVEEHPLGSAVRIIEPGESLEVRSREVA